jgi:hypothetical protein
VEIKHPQEHLQEYLSWSQILDFLKEIELQQLLYPVI